MGRKISSRSWEARRRLAAREPFETYGALRAVAGAMSGAWSPGRLPEPYCAQYIDAWRDNAIAYTVISYNTPIAWVLTTDDVVQPPVKYSITTTRHQGVLYALERPVSDFTDAAERERQVTREQVTERRARTREALDRAAAWAPVPVPRWVPAPAEPIESGPTFREDPGASLEDRMAALEAYTFAQMDSTEAIMERAREALQDQALWDATIGARF